MIEVSHDTLACTYQDYIQCTFIYPFRELFLWAVCNNMQEMAVFLWSYEEEGMCKAIIGAEINTALYECGRMRGVVEHVQNALLNNMK